MRRLLGKAADTHQDAFTIRAVAQDEFEDVQIPDAPVVPAHAPHMSQVTAAGGKQT